MVDLQVDIQGTSDSIVEIDREIQELEEILS
jgi:hypothetical protein